MTDDAEFEARRKAAYAKLDEAIEALSAAFCEVDGEVVVDAVLVVGAQSLDERGGRVGGVTIFPRNGCQPNYITTGLLQHALPLQQGTVCHCACNAD